MYDYPAAYDRRVRQFREYLVTMHDRAHEEVHGNCFLIFEERTGPAPGADVRARHETEARRSSAERRREPPAVEEEEEFLAALPSEGWRADDDRHRFVQFAFGRESFCVDLPRQTLYPLEARKILRDRTGFFYLRDRPEFTLPGEEAEGYDPFRKVYVYGDEQAAAADAAFVFFDVWRFLVEARLYVTAAAFSGKASWEQGHPIT